MRQRDRQETDRDRCRERERERETARQAERREWGRDGDGNRFVSEGSLQNQEQVLWMHQHPALRRHPT